MNKRLTDLEHAQNALARKKRTRAVLDREIAALEEMTALLARTNDLVVTEEDNARYQRQ